VRGYSGWCGFHGDFVAVLMKTAFWGSISFRKCVGVGKSAVLKLDLVSEANNWEMMTKK
jgi:hypothetical protein